MIKLKDLFDISYGTKLDLNKMKILNDSDPGYKLGMNFVSRTSRNQGIVAKVKPKRGITPSPKGSITVSLGGTKLLSAFIQESDFYTAQNVAVLEDKFNLTFEQKAYYCLCIRANRFRYSAFGREANRTLGELLVPEIKEIPKWVNDTMTPDLTSMVEPINNESLRIEPDDWKWFLLTDIFEIKKGKRLTKANMIEGDVPFIGAVDKENGITNFIGQDPIHSGNTITVNYNGSVGEAFYQEIPYWCSDDVNVLYPKFELNPYIAMFMITVLKQEKFRFNYGRKWHLDRMRETKIKLPDLNGEPDWIFMENYIKTLKFSKNI